MRPKQHLTQRVSAARQVAFQVLEIVAEGAFASDALRERSQSLSSRDAALASQIVFGCLRWQRQLDFLIYHYSHRPPESLDLVVRIVLQAAIFQLRYLDRVPAHAAVHESVEYVKQRQRAASGLTNAVLRKVTRDPVAWPDLETELSTPAWLMERWSSHFGAEAARSIAAASLQEPAQYVRIPPGTVPPAALDLEATNVPGAYRLLSANTEGLRLHDIGSQAISALLDLEPSDSYLDLCAAPGNKTMQALETPLKLAVACDISLQRLRDVPPSLPRVVLDATERLPFSQLFTKIFIDAPCSGTGTLARNPEIKWRLQEDELTRFRNRQTVLVSQALRLLAPGGRLLYATCSLEEEENEQVVREVLAKHPGAKALREVWRLPGREEGDGFYAAVLEKSTR